MLGLWPSGKQRGARLDEMGTGDPVSGGECGPVNGVRAHRVLDPGNMSGMTFEDLFAEVIRRVVREELDALGAQQPAAPVLVDRQELARALGVSVSTVDRLREDGMPTVWVVEAPRFEVEAVLVWLRERGAP